MSIVYPDIEKVLVSHLSTFLEDDVRVGTIKVPADQEQPSKQVVVTVSWAGDKNPARVLKFAGVVLDVYADDYATASELALQVEAGLRMAVGDDIKFIEIIAGPVRLVEDTLQEKRSLSAEVTVKAKDLP